jgi:hypothetical protein
VNREVDLVIEQGLFEFFGEEAFTPDIGEWAVGDAVAGGLNEAKFHAKVWPIVRELIGDELALGAGEQAGAGAEAEGGWRSFHR